MRVFFRPAVLAAAASLMIAAAGVYETHGSQPPAGYVPQVGDSVVFPWGETDRTWEVARIGSINSGSCLVLRFRDEEVVADLSDVRPAGPLFGL